MTFAKVIEVARRYREETERWRLDSPSGRRTTRDRRRDRQRHILHMVDQMETWGPEKMEKACRWLGFIQGALWADGVYSIEELKRHNMPPKDGGVMATPPRPEPDTD
jgi:hypothetical protein